MTVEVPAKVKCVVEVPLGPEAPSSPDDAHMKQKYEELTFYAADVRQRLIAVRDCLVPYQ